MPKERIAVALSGGVDSAVAAALLASQGHDVIAVVMRLWHETRRTGGVEEIAPAPDPTTRARAVAEALRVPLHVVDAVASFKQLVVDRFVAEYSAGRTPNPCLQCNRVLKFGYLLEHALALGASKLATGHYARIRLAKDGKRWELLKGIDRHKDQSYFLYMLGQRALSRAVFPLGEWTKDRVRAYAQERRLPVAETAESQDLCFVHDNDYRRFLRAHAPQAFVPGPILDRSGRQIGEHRGLAAYTVGQRRGIGISAPEALYVLRIDVARNAVIVGPESALGRDSLVADEVSWVSGQAPTEPVEVEVKIRYRARPTQARVAPLPDARATIHLTKPLRDITPGQGAVFYRGDVVLGGGLIANEP
jgi:tRNA-specific 2-thiouridylase